MALSRPGGAAVLRVAVQLPPGPPPAVPDWFEVRQRVNGEIVGRYQVLLRDGGRDRTISDAPLPSD